MTLLNLISWSIYFKHVAFLLCIITIFKHVWLRIKHINSINFNCYFLKLYFLYVFLQVIHKSYSLFIFSNDPTRNFIVVMWQNHLNWFLIFINIYWKCHVVFIITKLFLIGTTVRLYRFIIKISTNTLQYWNKILINWNSINFPQILNNLCCGTLGYHNLIFFIIIKKILCAITITLSNVSINNFVVLCHNILLEYFFFFIK